MREQLINYFFHNIIAKNYNYSILHHLESIYSINDDIDFIVNSDKNEMLKIVKDFVYRNNCYLANHYTIDKDIYRFDIFYFENGVLGKIELDCACNSTGNDLLEIHSSKLLQNRILVTVKGNKFFKISNTDEIEYYIKKKAFKNNDILSYSNYFKSLDKEITDKEIINKYQYWQEYFSSRFYKIKYFQNKVSLLIKRILEKPALTISFIGPDGSGKSTIINLLKGQSLFINNYYFHLKPIKQKNVSDNVVTDPHKYPPYTKLKSYVKLFYFVYQYNWGWIKNILPLKIKSSLIIFDRYFDDMLVDSKRYRYGGWLFMAKFARIFIPKPDIYFILTTDAKTIYARKQEVPFEELERQITEYEALADGKRYFKIDVNRSPEEITREIVTIMMEKMNERY